MKTERGFEMADRYKYDFGKLTTGNGWAQVDTSQDASYFGTWANPFTFQVFTYCEGDTTLQTCDDSAEFAQTIRGIKAWNENNGHRFVGIDPGFHEQLKAEFHKVGLGDLLH